MAKEAQDNSTPDYEKAHLMREALEQTVSASDFSAAAMRSMAENMYNRNDKVSYSLVRNLLDTIEESSFGTETDFRIETSEVTLADGPSDDRYPIGGDDGLGRYKVLGHLGSGAAGQVFDVEDKNFDRRIAVKFLHPDAAQRQERMMDFIKEARLSSQLEHPNILPIHDMNMSDSGMLYFSMQKAQGKSLKDLLEDAELSDYLGKEIRDVDDRVSIMIKVCDAIAYAHSRGIVHQDIKPSNIMIGQYGEVVLVDWGTAAFVGELDSGRGKLVGTPIYMSPEQAQRKPATYASDIYCLGSTLFHILLLRFPTWDNDIDTFWSLKQAGTINPIRKQERKRVPPPLLSIILKAMAVKPEDRYASVSDMLNDLKRFQHGQRVLAHKDTISDKLARLYRHNRRAVIVAYVGILALLVLGFFLYRELLKSESDWQLYYSEDFNETTLSEFAKDWDLIGFKSYNEKTIRPVSFKRENEWKIEDGALSYDSAGLGEKLNLVLRRNIPGDIRVEFDVYAKKDKQLVRCFIGGDSRFEGYHIHGSSSVDKANYYITRDNARRKKAHMTDGEENVYVDWQSGSIAAVKTQWGFKADAVYRYRYERSGNYLRFYVNDKKLMEVFDVDILAGPGFQRFGIELPNSTYIDNIKVFNRPLAQKVSPLAVADTYFRFGEYKQALGYYEALNNAYPGTDVQAQSLYRLGRCETEFRQFLKASNYFQTFLADYPNHRLRPYVLYEMGRLAIMQRKLPEAKQWFKRLADVDSERVRRLALMAILRYYLKPYKDLSRHNPTTILEPEKVFSVDMVSYLRKIEHEWDEWAVRLNTQLMDEHPVWMSIPFMYIRFAEYERVLERYNANSPSHWGLRETYMIQGRIEQMLIDYSDDEDKVKETLLRLKRYDELLERFPTDENRRTVYMKTGQYDKAFELIGDSPSAMASYLLAVGRYDDVIKGYRSNDWAYLAALIATNRQSIVELKDFPTEKRTASLCLILSGREQEIIDRYHITDHIHKEALGALIIRKAAAGEWGLVNKYLNDLESSQFDYWLTSITRSAWIQFALPPLMRFYQTGDRELLIKELEAVRNNPNHADIFYIQDMIGCLLDDNYQPNVLFGPSKIFKAIKMEIDGKPIQETVQILEELIEGRWKPGRNVLWLLLEWRLDVLKGRH